MTHPGYFDDDPYYITAEEEAELEQESRAERFNDIVDRYGIRAEDAEWLFYGLGLADCAVTK